MTPQEAMNPLITFGFAPEEKADEAYNVLYGPCIVCGKADSKTWGKMRKKGGGLLLGWYCVTCREEARNRPIEVESIR